MAKKTTAEILAEDMEFGLLKDGRLFGLNEVTATPFVVQVSPDPTEATPLEVCEGDLFSIVMGIKRSDEDKASFEPFRPLPTGVLDWERDATNTELVEELSRCQLGLDTDKMQFTFRALKQGTVSLKFNYNYVQWNNTTNALEVKTTATTAVSQVIKPATAVAASGTVATRLMSVKLDKQKYSQGEAITATYLFTGSNIDVSKLQIVTTEGITHTGTPTASGSSVADQLVVNTDAKIGTVQSVSVYYDGEIAKVAKLRIYDPTYVAATPWGYSLDAETPATPVAGPAVAAAGGPAVASLDDGGAAAPAAASLDDGAAEAAAAPASESKSSKKSKAVAD